MARHHSYSKRSRESLKARTDSTVECEDYPDCDECSTESWSTPADTDLPLNRVR